MYENKLIKLILNVKHLGCAIVYLENPFSQLSAA